MHSLSISEAWEESRVILTRDGRLFVSVALALLALPALVSGLANPDGMVRTSAPLWVSIVSIVAYLVALAGQLSLARLALGPSTTVGAAISHGVHRMPVYFLSVCILVAIMFVAAIPFAIALAAMGVPMSASGKVPVTPAILVAGILYLALLCFVLVRMVTGAAVASAEHLNSLDILKRSWALTTGHFWRLFLFLLLFFVAASLVSFGVTAGLGVVVRLFIGPVQPMSVAAILITLIHALLNAAVVTVLMVMIARIYVQLAGRRDAETGVPTTGT
jgi:hypothetical protein